MNMIKAGLADIERLLFFAERTFRIAYQADNDPVEFEAYCAQAFTVDQFRQEMENPHAEFWLGEGEGQLMAYVKLNYQAPHETLPGLQCAQVERIYVAPEAQGKGIGAALLDFSCEKALTFGNDTLWLSVWQKNPRAVKFYERCGFEICGTEIFDVGNDPQLDWVMYKSLI